MSEKPSSSARFWKTLREKGSTDSASLIKEPKPEPEAEPTPELSTLAQGILEILSKVQAATVFELQTRLGVESESEVRSAAGELKERELVTFSTRGKDVVVSRRG